MIGLAVILALALAGAIGTLTWLVVGRVAAADREADARVAQGAIEGKLERATFENEKLTKEFEAVDARATAFEEILREDIESSEDPDAGRMRVRARMLRLAQRWSATDSARNGSVHPDGGEALPPDPKTETSEAHPVSAGSGTLP